MESSSPHPPPPPPEPSSHNGYASSSDAGAASQPAPAQSPLWARLSVRHTKKTCFVAILVPLVCVGIIVGLGLLNLSDQTEYDFQVKDDPISEVYHGRIRAREEYPYATAEPEPFATSDGFRMFQLLLRNTRSGDNPQPWDPNAPRENLLTREGIAFLKRAEDEVINHPDYKLYCWRDPNAVDCYGRKLECAQPFSMTNFLYSSFGNSTANGGKTRFCRRNTSELVTQPVFDTFLNLLKNGSTINDGFAVYFGVDLNTTSLTTQVLQSTIFLGKPDENATDAKKEEERFNNWANGRYEAVDDMVTSLYHSYIVSGHRSSAIFGPTVTRDQMFAFGSVVLVWLCIWAFSTSSFLACSAMMQIILAFPLTFVVYAGVFRITYYAALQIITIFLILGIGADDVFVFADAWKQAAVVLGAKVDLESRMAWTYRRAVRAMTVTSFTTAIAFFCTAASPIMPISTLGVWAGLLVLLQFLLVITIFPSALVIWQRFWRTRRWYRCWRHHDPDSDQGDEERQSSSSMVNVQDMQVDESGFGDVQREVTTDEEQSGTMRLKKMLNRKDGELRPIERFFNGPWTKVTRVARFPLLVVAAAIFGVSIWLATKLETPLESEKFLPDDHPLILAQDLFVNGFPSSDGAELMSVRAMWGLSGIDRSKTNKYVPDDLGEPVFDNSFNMRSAAAQQRILDACNFFAEPSKSLITNSTTIEDKISCWVRDYLEWRGGKFQDFADDKALIEDIIRFGNAVVDGNRPYLTYLTRQRIIFNTERTRVLFTEVEFISRLRVPQPYAVAWPERNKWEKEREAFNTATRVAGVKDMVLSGGDTWTWAVTQKALVDNMYIGIGVVLAVSFASLTVSTGNVIVAFLALASIAGILTNVLAIIQLIGWKLGITESIASVISIGISFDYVAHLANAYVESPRKHTREQRVRAALTELGVSVLAGAISTVLGGSMLFFAIIVFFVKFGVFVVVTVSLALLWGLTFFPAFLHIAGPVGNWGEIWTFAGKLFCCRRDRHVEADEALS